MGKAIVGCISLVRAYDVDNRFVGIFCNKGRGFILPGGKCGFEETYKECAARELHEETGLFTVSQELIFQAPTAPSDTTHCFCFLAQVREPRNFKDSSEGKVTIVTWEMLMTSKYKAYYELLKEEYEKHGQR